MERMTGDVVEVEVGRGDKLDLDSNAPDQDFEGPSPIPMHFLAEPEYPNLPRNCVEL